MKQERRGYIGDVEWYIRCGASALGERGTSESLFNMLRFGPPTAGGLPNTDLYSDRQIGWCKGEGEVSRARRCHAIWARLPVSSQEVLLGRYESRQWPPGVSGALGDMAGVVVLLVAWKRARERIDGAAKALAALTEEPWSEAKAELEATAQQSIIPSDWGEVADTCQSLKPESAKRRAAWLKRAGKALDEAHDDWIAAAAAKAQEWAS